MKKKAERWIGLSMAFLLALGCSEFQEPQIDQQQVEIFVPRDSLHTDIATQLFYWYHVEGAEKYELQIVTPSFDRIDRLVLDTNVAGNKFEFTLQPGTYQWSLRAYNFSSSTGYTTHALFIDSTLDLGSQKVVLTSPPNRDTTNGLSKNFNWKTLYNAKSYHFELWAPQVGNHLLETRDLTENFLNLNLTMEGSYEWRVRGENAQSQTVYTTRGFFVDTSGPAAPQLTSPPQGQFFNTTPIDFSWTRGPDAGSSVRDTFYLANDSGLVQIRQRIYSFDREATVDTLSPGIYYWGVRSFDQAGNTGNLSTIRQFTLQ